MCGGECPSLSLCHITHVHHARPLVLFAIVHGDKDGLGLGINGFFLQVCLNWRVRHGCSLAGQVNDRISLAIATMNTLPLPFPSAWCVP
jgi:hypothetical protein